MRSAKPKPTRMKPGPVKSGATYRGVRLQATSGRSRFTLEQIEQAVEAAVVKNADALARRS
jgi:hypothetical protein